MDEVGPQPIRYFDSFGILPRVIRYFMAEKSIEIPRHEVDLLLGENRDPEYLKLNPSGQTPALELSDGTIISEAPVICEFLDESFPETPLIGRTSKDRAVTRMWWRRAELNICQPMILGFYYSDGLETYRSRMRCIPEAADGMKERGRDGMRWLNKLLRGEWIAGPSFTVADIHLFCFLDDLVDKGQDIPADCEALRSWHERAGNRKAAEMSLWRWRSGASTPERPVLSC